MNRPTIRIQFERVGKVAVPLPALGTAEAAGLDLRAALAAPVQLMPGERRLLPTGLRVAIPSGYEGQVRPRSGLALRAGVTVLNSPGTIDSDYRGEIGILLINHGADAFTIQPLDRIAQLLIAPAWRAEFVEGVLDGTERGGDGYGSTGLS